MRVKLTRPLRDATGKSEVDLDAREPGLLAALAQLADEYPRLHQHLFEDGHPSPHVNVYVNGRAVFAGDAAGVELAAGDEVLLLLPITGG